MKDHKMLDNGLLFSTEAIELLEGDPKEKELRLSLIQLAMGIELIVKDRLANEHWSLVFETPQTAKPKKWEEADFKSVGYSEAIKRLESITGQAFSRQEDFQRMIDQRNKLIHLGLAYSVEAMKASASKAIGALIEFINERLPEDERTEDQTQSIESLVKSTTKFEHYVQGRLSEIEVELDGFTVLKCLACSMPTLKVDCGIKCLFCSYETDDVAIASESFAEVMEYRDIHQCPACEWNTMVYVEPEYTAKNDGIYLCFDCNRTWEDGELDDCSGCGSPIEEVEGLSLCGDCIRYRLSKDD